MRSAFLGDRPEPLGGAGNDLTHDSLLRSIVPTVHLAFANDPRHYRGNSVTPLVMEQHPSHEGGPRCNHRDIHPSDTAPAAMLTMPGEIVDRTRGCRFGRVLRAGGWIARGWIDECHRKTPTRSEEVRSAQAIHQLISQGSRFWPQLVAVELGPCPSELKFQTEFHCERASPKSLLAHPTANTRIPIWVPPETNFFSAALLPSRPTADCKRKCAIATTPSPRTPTGSLR
jgi:hypothetical protein